MSTATDPRLDRLYQLLPAIYRMRDAAGKYPLQALLRVISEQVNVTEDDIARLYENWFIETSQDWVVPYIGDLIGYRPVLEAGSAGDGSSLEGRMLNRVLIPRRDVANTIRYRRRKGTVGVLELLAHDVADWPARAVEFFKLLGWNQNINHPHLRRARTVSLRRREDLDLIGTPFDHLARTVDVRRIDSHRTQGLYNIPSVGLFVWRLRSYSVTTTPAECLEESGPHCYTFSVLGHDTPLFTKPEPATDRTVISAELSVPQPIRRYPFARHRARFYGPGRSFAIWAEGWPGAAADGLIPESAIVPADLGGWHYTPPAKHVAVDPVRGRIVFPPGSLPKKSVRVAYHYGFSADVGGGEYARPILDPVWRGLKPDDPRPIYRVGKDQPHHKIGDALAAWQTAAPKDAVIELTESAVYVEQIGVTLGEDQTLQIRAADQVRPVIRMLDWKTDLPDALSVTMARGSRFSLDGLLITGRAVQITGSENPSVETKSEPICSAEVSIRHCTLVPGWAVECGCDPKRPAEPSLEFYNVRAQARIEHSIVGSIQIHQDEVRTDPMPISVTDSILDATGISREAIGAPGFAVAHAVLTIARSTVFGIVDVHAIEKADDSIFMGCVNVARRQLGCMRFCYVPPNCRTPRRYNCQPDLVVQALKKLKLTDAQLAALTAGERLRVRPQFTSERYGRPGYGQLGRNCAVEIKRGAEDESEMGVFHDLFQPQREANLAARLEEYTPAGMDAGIVFAT
ncbi:MAG: hypothetical protein HYX46_07540 [Betaproteobacteria bacterium]|nr:hypothetical protein [Betaproteobacteria bacterium]